MWIQGLSPHDLLFDSGIANLYVWGVWALTALVHVLLAIGVARDGLEVKARHGRLELVGVTGWCLATLVGGVVPAAVYWLLHRSRWRAPPEA